MGRKNRSRKLEDPGKGDDFRVNPFAELHVSVPKEPQPAPPPPPAPVNPAPRSLTDSDRELLREFGASADSDTGDAVRGTGVVLRAERKGRGGKTVTCVLGLEDMPMARRMTFCRELSSALGTGARFLDDVLEIRGDLRERASAWFAARGYRPRPG